MYLIKKIKWWQWLLGVLLISYLFAPKDYKPEGVKAMEARNAKIAEASKQDSLMRLIPFKDMTMTQKETLLNNFIEGKKEAYTNSSLIFGEEIKKAFEAAVKFPSSLEYLHGTSWAKYPVWSTMSKITDIEKGEVTISSQYRSENNFGQKVKNYFTIKYSYDGKQAKILDSKLK